MGIFHFAGLGKSPGAVTAGLCYIKNEHEELGILNEKEAAGGIVIFTSPEIISGTEKTQPPIVNNEFMKRSGREIKEENSLEIVKRFLHNEFSCEVHICDVNVLNFSECFEAVAKVLLKFHSPGDVGKHIWANLTGGTNPLNLALQMAAQLSGFIPVLYYTFVSKREDTRYLKSFSRDVNEFDFRRIYVFKTTFDQRYYYVLEELEGLKEKETSGDLLNRLKGNHPTLFADMDIATFRRDYLNTMISVDRWNDLNSINQDGRTMLKIMRQPWFKALIRQDHTRPHEIGELTKDLKIREI